MSRFVVQADRAVVCRIVGPALTDLDVQEEMHRPLEQAPKLVASAGADLLDARAPLAQNDGALALALNVYRLLDAHRTVAALLPLVGLDRGLVGQLLMQL